MLKILSVALGLGLSLQAASAMADIEFIEDVTYGPKRSPAAAIIGQASREEDSSGSLVRMLDAAVDIYIANPQVNGNVALHGKAVFKMENISSEDRHVVVAFPLGDRSYSGHQFKSFTVHQDAKPIPVFSASGGYKMPWRVEPIDPQPGVQPPTLPLSDKEIYAKMWRGLPVAGKIVEQMLLWEAEFPAQTQREIVVEYRIEVPQQSPAMMVSRRQGTRAAAALRQDSISVEMSEALAPTKHYLFFGYIVATGASWSGSIGREAVKIHLDSLWRQTEPALYMRTQKGTVARVAQQLWRSKPAGDGWVATVFDRHDFEPGSEDDLYLALEIPGASGAIGVATLEADGTLVLLLRAQNEDGSVGDARLSYTPDHPKYAEIMRHIGDIRPGEEKPVLPW